VAVFRALQLGDLLCAVPAFRALRRALPSSEITLLGLPWAAEFAARFHHLVDRFEAVPGVPGLPEQPPDPRGVVEFLAKMQADPFDLAIQMHGSGLVTNPLVELLRARRTAGFVTPGHYRPDPDLFLPYPDDLPEVRRHLALMEHLGAPPAGEELEFPVTPDDRETLRAVPGIDDLGTDYACLHPGGRSARRWAPARFADVGDALARRGLAVVLTGTGEERAPTAEVADRMQTPALDLAGATSLGAVGALVQGARVVVSNDTGISHLAAALRVPSVVVYLSSDPARWAPLDADLHRRLTGEAVTAPDVLAHVDAVVA
jgi:ADP-heptose:LPS heptosyltransferase